jgi:subtilisin family serine protease
LTYVEQSGTSMAAAHVSGVIAAFLSVRPEFIGRPRQVKSLLTGSATDLGRERLAQGAGVVDLMRMIENASPGAFVNDVRMSGVAPKKSAFEMGE